MGFVSRPLYLTPEFLRGKPVEVLLDDEKLVAEDLNDDSLGRALDRLFEVGVTEIFAHVVSRALGELEIRVEAAHLDSTSFSLAGDYEARSSLDEKAITITHGYSRDRRPDLKQAVLGMICAHASAIPVWLSALDANSSDSASFPGMVEAYVARFEAAKEEPPTVVADSALYSAGTLQRIKGLRWITRVPTSIAEVKTLYRTVPLEQMLPIGDEEEDNYRIWPVEEVGYYGEEVAQRWLLVYSEAAYRREASGLRRQIAKERAEAEKTLKKLARRTYPGREAAIAVVETLADTSWRFHTASEVEPIPVPKYHRSGRPREDQQPDYVLWRPAGKVREDTEAIESALITKGKFVLATSELDRRGLTDEALIELYKAQNTTVERGFRFLKDPLFFASGLFLKKPERVMALLMVMGLCLLIYAACEQIVRGGLARREETLPEQRGKPTPTPTMRRVLQIFEGIEVLTIEHPGGRRSRVVLNLSELHRRILDLLGVAPHGSVDEG